MLEDKKRKEEEKKEEEEDEETADFYDDDVKDGGGDDDDARSSNGQLHSDVEWRIQPTYVSCAQTHIPDERQAFRLESWVLFVKKRHMRRGYDAGVEDGFSTWADAGFYDDGDEEKAEQLSDEDE
ncbi:unnamed protein product [Schistocephalus solidus]|uniref:Uncharacterized protein n=1 Tax=Schistocephalus solidus TaxID=70667 RepID=A0A183TCA6_SCHSO|nr:unnamed protein product [Schistocephalus solidus]